MCGRAQAHGAVAADSGYSISVMVDPLPPEQGPEARALEPRDGRALAFHHLSATELRAGFKRGEYSPTELVVALSERISTFNPALNALTTVAGQCALDGAAEATARYLEGSARPLEGLPVVVKDLIDTGGLRTTYGSRVFAGHVPSRDAEIVRALRANGALIIGKGATHEFGWGITTESEYFGPTRNPWALDRVPGGSSGGAAAALAAGFAPLAIGTDTGGSIRIPAGWCGVCGLKPTYGRLPATGAFPLAPTLDHLGPMARTPQDLALLMGTVARRAAARRVVEDATNLRGLRIGRIITVGGIRPDASILATVEQAARIAIELGANVDERSLPGADQYPAFAAILAFEARRVHVNRGLWPARAAEYSWPTRERLERAAAVEAADYRSALETRARLVALLASMFSDLDYLLLPVAPLAPPAIGAPEAVRNGDRSLTLREAVMTFTAPFNLSGLPSIAYRAGFDDDGLPIGVQLVGRPGSDRRLVAVAEALWCESASPGHWIDGG